MDELTSLANKYGTDKGSEDFNHLAAKNYTQIYDQYFQPMRQRPLVILELGIAKGGSLKMWHDYFPYARVIGIDKDINCSKHQGDRIEIVIGDCTDHKFLSDVFGALEFDIVIDDASHDSYDVIKSFEFLGPKTKKYYCVEDLHAAHGIPRYLNDNKIKHDLHKNLAIIPCAKNQSL